MPELVTLMLGLVVVSPCLLQHAEAHGRLIEPPSRATMWRYGFSTPPNYNDHELYCGGFTRQWQRNGGKCGICGDAWDIPTPRPHEAGGKYAQGIIVRRYKKDSAITIRVELTANHRGYFEFRICPNNAPRSVATQACLDKYVLRKAKFVGASDEQNHETRYYPSTGNKVFETRYLLPPGLTCSQCILQWRYIAGNNWGTCEDGTGAVGCGHQEEFRACADVEIVDSTGTADETPFDNEIPTHDENKNTEVTTVPTEDTTAPVSTTDWWLLAVLVACALIAVASTLALMYLYYYHARDLVKRWLGERGSRNRLNNLYHHQEQSDNTTTTQKFKNSTIIHVQWSYNDYQVRMFEYSGWSLKSKQFNLRYNKKFGLLQPS